MLTLRSEAWPIYIRLEGLPFKEKNKFENVIMAGITFTRKPPTEQLLTEIFSRLRQELIQLRESGIPVVNENDDCTWLCTPILANGVIDFGIMNMLDIGLRFSGRAQRIEKMAAELVVWARLVTGIALVVFLVWLIRKTMSYVRKRKSRREEALSYPSV
ncbi:hypothetical protein GCK32_007185 [Trichostrongylus colubriformis]|uniref:Uncharacterized protein n=1 Tax=Trichostrongylus colubriformis TaxID=6319 RepID=A0AAN8IWN2_TRICO